MSEPRQLRPDDAPTPFSADEIRDATPPGHTVVTMTGSSDGEPERFRTTFTKCDDAGATLAIVPLDEAGQAAGPAAERRVTWTELQAHASFPASATEIRNETILTPLGRLECQRYDVAEGEVTQVFWFSPSHPGMPVRFGTRRGEKFESITTIMSITQPDVAEVGLPTRRRKWFGRS